MTYSGVIEIVPIPKGRPRFTRQGQAYTPQKTRAFEDEVALSLRSEIMEVLYPEKVPLAIWITFYMPRPKSAPKSRVYPICKPDVDNLCKSFLDAAEGYLFTNDSQIVNKNLMKLYSDNPRIEYTIGEVKLEPHLLSCFFTKSPKLVKQEL